MTTLEILEKTPVSEGWPTTDRLSVLQSVITHESDDPISEWTSNIQAAINAAAWAVENRPKLEALLIEHAECMNPSGDVNDCSVLEDLRAILKGAPR